VSPLLTAFPQRPLVLRPGRGAARGWGFAMVGLLLFGGFLVMLAVEIVPVVRSDLAIRDRAVPAPQVRVADGMCRSRLFVFQSCEVTLRWRDRAGQGTRKVSYMFVAWRRTNWAIAPMMDPARPDLVSTDLGLDRLGNRIATLIGWGVIGIGLVSGTVLVGRGTIVKARQVRAVSGRVLQPVAVQFAGWGEGPSWRVRDEHGATFEWPVRKSDVPLMLDAQRGLVLALRPREGGPAFPLDEKLRFVRLTEHERARVEAARRFGAPVR
jgi:hypothetical protein